MRSVAVLTLAAIAAAYAVVRALPAEHEASADNPHPQQILGVSFDGGDAKSGHGLPVSALRGVLATKPGDTLDPATLAHDRAALHDLLASRGYLAATIDAPTVTFSSGGAYVVFSIAVGDRYHFRDISLAGVGAREAGLVTIGAWDTASLERVERVRQALEAAVHQPVAARITTDAAASAVDVQFATRAAR